MNTRVTVANIIYVSLFVKFNQNINKYWDDNGVYFTTELQYTKSQKDFPNRGSISAEHGLGFKKRNFIHFSKSDSAVFLMKQIKQVKNMKINSLDFVSIYEYVLYFHNLVSTKNSLKPTKPELQVFDPKGIMNPYKVLPDQWASSESCQCIGFKINSFSPQSWSG